MSFARKSPLRRGGRLTASRWGVYSVKRDNWRRDFLPSMTEEPAPKYTAFELAWFAFVRTLPCCASRFGRCFGPMQAAHLTLNANQKGWGMKVPHDQTAPLCLWHHDCWDGRAGQANNPFAGWSKDRRYDFAAGVVENVRRAAVPEDRAQAYALAELRIGVVIGDGTPTGFSWLPGCWSDVDAVGLAAAGERLIGAMP
jgi:hypothetical protein